MSNSNQENLCLPNPSLLAAPSPPQPMARIWQDIISQSVPGSLWMETIHSTLGKGRTFVPIPSPQLGPQNTLAVPLRVLQNDHSFAEQRSGLSPFLIVSSLSLFAFGTNSSQTGLSTTSPASHYPQGNTLHGSKEEQQFLLSPRTMAAPLPAQEETQGIAKPLISATLMFIRGQVQQQSTGDKLLGLLPARRAGTVFREAVLNQTSPS